MTLMETAQLPRRERQKRPSLQRTEAQRIDLDQTRFFYDVL